MQTFQVTTFIKRPLQEVFDFVTNPANSVQWQTGTESAKWSTTAPVSVGSIAHSVGRLLGREFVVDTEITQWTPPNVWGQKASSGPLKFENTNKFESKDGGTLLIQSFQGEIGGFFKMAEGLAIKQLQKQVETDGQALKKLLEAK
jgi:ligand-binding SRPBCC domain-containing protein